MMVRKEEKPRDILTWINECLVVEVLPKAFKFRSLNFAGNILPTKFLKIPSMESCCGIRRYKEGFFTLQECH